MFPAVWGRADAFAKRDDKKPTGLYLSPGKLAYVTVPVSMVNAGYQVLVGGQTTDNSNKDVSKRMDRVTAVYPIVSTTTLIANPLGGGVYIQVPYLANLGVVTVQIIGGVIESPLFQMTSFKQMTNTEWASRRTAPGPWADFETDKFMLTVPRSWIYAYADPVSLLQKWDVCMDGVAEVTGFKPEERNRRILYVAPDLHIMFGVYGIGFPQVNNLYDAKKVSTGNENHWFLKDPSVAGNQWPTEYHELGHAQLPSMYPGETESVIHMLFTYVRNKKFGDTLDVAFASSIEGPFKPTVDDAAVHWMVTANFRDGKQMDRSATPDDEIRYQHRGHAKYVDIVRLFGWEAWTGFLRQENLDINAGITNYKTIDGLDAADSRTLRLSIKAGVDLTPLIHFWGQLPVNPTALAAKISEKKLPKSETLKALLQRYKTLIPKDNAEFKAFLGKVYPNPNLLDPTKDSRYQDTRYGFGWFASWASKYGSAEGTAAIQRLDNLLVQYGLESPVISTDPTTATVVSSTTAAAPTVSRTVHDINSGGGSNDGGSASTIPSSDSTMPIIIGSSVGGGVILMVIAAFIVYKRRQRRSEPPLASTGGTELPNASRLQKTEKSNPVAATVSKPTPVARRLPPGWEEHRDEGGMAYYYNAHTQQSQWERPS